MTRAPRSDVPRNILRSHDDRDATQTIRQIDAAAAAMRFVLIAFRRHAIITREIIVAVVIYTAQTKYTNGFTASEILYSSSAADGGGGTLNYDIPTALNAPDFAF